MKAITPETSRNQEKGGTDYGFAFGVPADSEQPFPPKGLRVVLV
jgi:hypothetical protein